MGQPAARLTDLHTCPMVTGVVPHVGGPITAPGCPTVLIGGLPAARVTDEVTCAGPPDMIAKGSLTVTIGGLPAARMGDPTAHGGIISTGCPTVLIGDKAGGGVAGGGGIGDAGAGGESGPDDSGGVGNTDPWGSMDELLSSGPAMPAPLQQARTLVAAARLGTPFCQRCAAGR